MTLAAQLGIEMNGFRLAIDLDAQDGRTVAIVGPNGAGKTTALRAVAGLRPVYTGRIAIDGAVLDDPEHDVYVCPERRPIAMVFQEHRLFPHLDALDNVAFGVRERGRGKRVARATARDWLERVGLGDRVHARPRELSGGQAQRVALARALACEPRVLLLDEPLAALDATTRNEVRRELRMHLSTFPGVRLVVTHDPVDVAVLADEVVVLDEGVVVQRGAPSEMTARPRSKWVAEMAGTNLFAGAAGTGGHIDLDGGGALLSAEAGAKGRVFAVVAPRAVSLHPNEPGGSARNSWRGSIETLEPIGDRVRVRVRGEPSVVAEITARAAHALALREADDIWVAVKATEIDVYPA